MSGSADLLSFGISSTFCSANVPGIRAFRGKSLLLFFFLFVSLAIPWFRLLSHISSLRVSSTIKSINNKMIDIQPNPYPKGQ